MAMELEVIGAIFCVHMILFLLLLCCCSRHRRQHSDEDEQDRRVESSTNSAPTTTGDDGVDSAVPSSLPVFVYSTAHEGKLECSLCLTEFRDGEVGRFLPRCCHGFHKDRVDACLSSQR